MATPITAGSAALVRQYFEGGFFRGVSHSLDALAAELGSAGFSPSAALVKATLLNGASRLTGVFRAAASTTVDLPGSVRASPYEGFGRVSLADSLAVASLNQDYFLEVPGLKLREGQGGVGRVRGAYGCVEEPSLSHGEQHDYCFILAPSVSAIFESSREVAIQATLVWTDPPASPAASR
jgi:hypothetical protein